MIAEHSRVAQGKAKTLTPYWITRAGGIADKSNALMVREIGPISRTLKSCQRSNRFCIRVGCGWRSAADAFAYEFADIGGALQTTARRKWKRTVCADAFSLLRKEIGDLTDYGVDEHHARILRNCDSVKKY